MPADLPSTSRNRNILVLGASLLGVLFVLNLVTVSRTPIVWFDEVMYTDPAVNLSMGRGLISTLWPGIDAHAFWAGNVPLHQVLLAGWLKVFPLSVTSARAINLFYVVLVVGVLDQFCRRTALVISAKWRVCFWFLLTCGYGIALAYRSGRYDGLGMLLVSVAAYLWVCGRRPVPLLLLGVTGMLMVLAGLQLLPFAVALAALAVLFAGRQYLAQAASLFTGFGFGVVVLYAVYRHFGVWEAFLQHVKSPRAAQSASLHQSLLAAPLAYFRDFSSFSLLLVGLLLLIVTYKWKARGRFAKPLVFAMVAGLLLPPMLQVLGHYPRLPGYLGWMPYLAILVPVISACERSWDQLKPRWRWAVGAILLCCGLIGLPAQIFLSATEWNARNEEQIEKVVQARISPNDVVLADFQAYYAMKRNGTEALFTTNWAEMPADQKHSVSVLLVDPDLAPLFMAQIGGQWQASDVAVTSHTMLPLGSLQKRRSQVILNLYNLRLYRKVLAPLSDAGSELQRQPKR